jgi:hypothetical protein
MRQQGAPRAAMDTPEALEFVRNHGIVLVAANGPVPKLTEAIAGVPIKGSWWGHPMGHEIYRVLNEVEESPDVLVCRIVAKKVTLVHRRLWPALIRCSDRFAVETLARVEQVHTDAGHHVNVEIPFPEWASSEERRVAARMSEVDALEALGVWASQPIRSK